MKTRKNHIIFWGAIGLISYWDSSKAIASGVSNQVSISNYSFETPALAQNGSYEYDPSGASWTFTPVGSGNGGSGIATPQFEPGYGFGGYTPPNGTQYGFVQQAGSMSQTLSFPSSGNYMLSMYLAGRPYDGNQITPNDGNQTLAIDIDQTKISTATTTTSQAFELFTTDFNSTAGNHVLTIAGPIYESGKDDTAYIDAVQISAIPEPASGSFFVVAAIGLLSRRRGGVIW